MSGTAWVGVVIGAVVLVAVAAVGIGGFATTNTTIVSEGATIAMPPADGSHGVVAGKYRSSSGFSVFGWDITPSTWEAQVMFVPPEGCFETEKDRVVAEGAFGDLVISRVDPLEDIVAFSDPASAFSHVLKGGEVVVDRS